MRGLATRALALAGAAALLGCADTRPFRGVALDPPRPAPELRATTGSGRTFDLAQERGKVVLIFFGYTHCPDFCPATLSRWATLRDSLGSRADDVRFVFVSVDPDRDTPEVVERYAKSFDSTFVGLSLPREELSRLEAALHTTSYPEPHQPGESYTMGHGTQTFVVDRDGRLRLLHTAGSTVADYREDVERLLD